MPISPALLPMSQESYTSTVCDRLLVPFLVPFHTTDVVDGWTEVPPERTEGLTKVLA